MKHVWIVTGRGAVALLVLALAMAALTSAPGFAADAVASVAWDVARPLTWADFRGRPPQNAASLTQAAAVHMTLGWRATLDLGCAPTGGRWHATVDRASLVVTNTMEPLESWVAAGKAEPQVLLHEQGHFDLNEVYRRRLWNALVGLTADAATRAAAEESLRSALQQASSRLLTQASDAQARYDQETSHGMNGVKQGEWRTSIASWLASLPLPFQAGKAQTR